ncbi:MAG TPA: hypothetical protein VHW72_16975, partial [Candidatus Angelobacter sp.]|nr:hypothetical protein [Candidatus Angelobacter sp.]
MRKKIRIAALVEQRPAAARSGPVAKSVATNRPVPESVRTKYGTNGSVAKPALHRRELLPGLGRRSRIGAPYNVMLLDLQRARGNRAVQRIIQQTLQASQQTTQPTQAESQSVSNPVIEAKTGSKMIRRVTGAPTIQRLGWSDLNPIEAAKRLAARAWDAIKGLGSSAWDAAKSIGSQVWENVKAGAGAVWNTLQAGAGAGWAIVKRAGTGAWNAAKTLGSQAWN